MFAPLQAVPRRLDILLVDDDQGDLALFRRAVDKTGLPIRLQTLTAGQQAIDYLEAKGSYSDRSAHPLPDVIVVDLKMPRVSGFDFLAWRKASRVFSSIPVVVLSGGGDPASATRAMGMGADKFIAKPSDWSIWQHIVQEIWAGTQGTSQVETQRAVPEAGRSG